MDIEKFVTANELATELQVEKDFIDELCKEKLLKAIPLNDIWNIDLTQKLPCLKQFKKGSENHNEYFKFFTDEYELVQVDGFDHWYTQVTVEDNHINLKGIWLCKVIYRDSNGQEHQKFALETDSFTKVVSLDESLDLVLKVVDYVQYTRWSQIESEVVGIFDTEYDAYLFGKKMYREIQLNETIKLAHKLCHKF